MKKLLLVICLLFVLCGCKSINENSVLLDLDKAFEKASEVGKYRRNNIMDYYEYYLPSDMFEETLDSDSIVLRYNDSRVIMNLNISSIVNSAYYPSEKLKDDGFFNQDNLIYTSSGNIISGELKNPYCFNLYRYNDQYVLHLFTKEMNFYGTTNLNDVSELAKHLLTVANNVNVKSEEIVANYAKKDVIDYQKKQINLFDRILPANGELVSMLLDDAVIGDGIMITSRDNDQYDNGQYVEEVDILNPVGGNSFEEDDNIEETNK